MVSKKITLGIILALSFLIRIIHIRYDLPMINVADEAGAGIYGTLNMLAEKSIIIPKSSYVNYSGLTSYIYLPFAAIWTLVLLVQMGSLEAVQQAVILDNAAQFMMIERLVSALAGVITVYFVFKIAKNLIGEKWALLASLLTSINLIFLIETTFGRPWGVCTMFLTIAIYYFLKKKNFQTGLFCGLAYAVHIAGGFLFLPLFIIGFIKHGKKMLKSIMPFIAMVLLISILHPDTITQNLALVQQTVTGDNLSYFGISFIERFTIFPEILLKYFLLQSLLIATAFIFKKNKKTIPLLLICIGYYIVIGPILGTEITRYLTPIMPLFAILAADSFRNLVSKKILKPAGIILVAAAIWSPLFWNIAVIKPSTLELTHNWVQNNLADEEWVIVEETDLGLMPSQETLQLIKDYESPFYLKREQMVEEMQIEDGYNYANLYMFEGYEEELLSTLNGYLITYKNELPDQTPLISFYSLSETSITDNKLYENIPFIYLPNLLRSGPDINIYKWQNT